MSIGSIVLDTPPLTASPSLTGTGMSRAGQYYDMACQKPHKALDRVPRYLCDGIEGFIDGHFDYLLLKVECPKLKDEFTYVIRSTVKYPYASYIYEIARLEILPLRAEPQGGGVMQVQAAAKKIHLYGTSVGFSQADHLRAGEILKDEYPEYTVTIEKSQGIFYEVPFTRNYFE